MQNKNPLRHINDILWDTCFGLEMFLTLIVRSGVSVTGSMIEGEPLYWLCFVMLLLLWLQLCTGPLEADRSI